MKNSNVSKIILGLFVLLFINADVYATGKVLPDFRQGLSLQDSSLTCWAAALRMITNYYKVDLEEKEIRSIAHDGDISNRNRGTTDAAETLARSLINTLNTYVASSLSLSSVKQIIDENRPIIAVWHRANDMGWPILGNGAIGHMVVIAGYQDIPDPANPGNVRTIIYYGEPSRAANGADRPNFKQDLMFDFYEDFVRLSIGNGIVSQWLESIYMGTQPPATKQYIVGKSGIRNSTIMAGLGQANLPDSFEIVHIITPKTGTGVHTYEEQVTIGRNKSNIVITPTPPWHLNPSANPSTFTRPLIKSPNALRVDGRAIRFSYTDIEGSNAVHNTGTLEFRDVKVSAASGSAIYNTGSITIDTGTVSAASGYAAIYNNSGAITLRGSTEIKSASGDKGVAIYNEGIYGVLSLSDSPTITGHIMGFHAGRLGVAITPDGETFFKPGDKKYILNPANLNPNNIAVVNGEKFIDNFELVNPNFYLEAIENHLFAILDPKEVTVGENGADFKTLQEALNAVYPWHTIRFTDATTYNESVTFGSTNRRNTVLSDVAGSVTFEIYVSPVNPAPQNYSGLNLMSAMNAPVQAPNDNIEDYSALRILGAQEITIKGVNIKGNNAIYNTGSVTISDAAVFAASDYALYNTGTAIFENVNVSATTDTTIYNTGALAIQGETVVTASNINGTAIYNDGDGGSLILGGAPAITGRIAGFGAGRVSVYTSGDYAFMPNDKKYILAPNNLKSGDVVVVGGANFINNFSIVNPHFTLAVRGNDLAAYSPLTHVTVNRTAGSGANFDNITSALNAIHNSQGYTVEILGFNTYNEQVTVGSSQPGTTIKSTGSTIEYNVGSSILPIEDKSALRIFDAQGIVIDRVTIRGSNAIYNTGSVNINYVTAAATSDHAIHNAGTVTLRNNAWMTSASNYAIYNTGTVRLDSVTTVSGASGYAAVYNNSGTLTITGQTTLTTASGINGTAIYNGSPDGSLVLGNSIGFECINRLAPGICSGVFGSVSPVITGRIEGFSAGNVSVIGSGTNTFNPNSMSAYGVTKRYTLAPANLRSGDVVVVGGANFINNFELVDRNFTLARSGNNIIANRINHANVTVSFGLNGSISIVPTNIVVASGSKLSEVQVPAAAGFTKQGYINNGKWYTFSNSEYREFVFGENGTPVTENTTLYLQWTAAAPPVTANNTVSFNLNGGTGIAPSGIVVSSGSTLSIEQMPSAGFIKPGYVNDGRWYTISNSKYNEFIFGEDGTPVTGNTTLYLKWTELVVPKNTVSFNLNGGTGTVPADIVVSYASKLSAEQMPSPTDFTKTDYINDGKWYTISNSVYREFLFGENGTFVTGNTTLYLKWTALAETEYTVSFNLNGGTGAAPADIVVLYATKLSEEQMPSTAGFTRSGFVNDGKWYAVSNLEYTEFVFGENSIPVISNITLYLKWTVSFTPRHIVSFNLNGGTGTIPADIALPSNGRLGIEQMPSTAGFTRTGFVNDGKWYTISNNSQYREFVFGSNGTMVSGNITLYLRWTAVAATNNTVSFNLNGGAGTTPANIIVASGSRLSAAQMPSTAGFTRTGYTNDGKWYTLSNSVYSEFIFGTNGTPVTANTTLYLRWTAVAVTNHTVSFNLNGGTGITPASIVVASGSRLSAAQMPSAAGFTRSGYTNDGKWYTLSNSVYSEFIFGTNGTPVTANTTLYLQWSTKPDTTYSNRFTAGPNPASKQMGVINFF
ncbi:MAG: InlB B-repeat-containing protein [Treponema sp.]|nr:InlB B-repeat-containing protein [Treponema sp.]